MCEYHEENGRVGRLRTRLAAWNRIRLGAWGEWIALGYLRRKGWDILARNWVSRRGELDLVAYHQETLVFVEVKTRMGPTLFPPETALDERKRDQLEIMANRFQLQYDLMGSPIRFDLIAIETEDRKHYQLRHYLGFM